MRKLSTLRSVVTRSIAVAVLALCGSFTVLHVNAQLLQQDFSSSTTVSSYVSATPTNGQWNAISSSGGGVVLSINTTGSNKLRFARTGNAGIFSRTTDFSPTPGTMMYRFDIAVSGNSAAQTTAAVWQIGSGFGTANSTEANASTHSRLGLNWTTTAGQFSLRKIDATAVNTANYTGTQTVTWVVNNSGSTATYRAPDGTNESIGNDLMDLWVGTTLEFNDLAVTTSSQTLTDLKFAITAGTGTVDQDNILIDPIPLIPTSAAASAVTSNSFQANWSTVAGVTGYSIDVSTSPTFASFVTGYNNLYVAGQATNLLSVTGLSASTQYYYRVRGTSQYTVGSFSSGNSSDQTLTTPGAGSPNLTSSALTAFGAQCINAGPYGPNTFTISGTDLTAADVTVAALSGFEYSSTGGAPYFASLSLAQGGGTYGPVTIHVRFNPTAVLDYSGDIVVGGGGASNINRPASGSGIDAAPTVTTGAASAITANSATVAGQINDPGCGTITAYGIEYSTTMGFTPGTGTQEASTNISGINYSSSLTGLSPCTTYYMRAYATRAAGTTYGSEGTFATSTLAAPVASSASSVTSAGFTANWGTSPGAAGYRLDVYTQTITLATDLFFSEYVEGSGNNKYLEIFNGTGASVALSDYEILVFANGSASATGTLPLTGTLANNSTIVYENPSATIYGGATTTSGVLNYNGNDAVALYKVSTTSYVDIIGEIGNNPGTEWSSGAHSTLDQTLRRKSTVTSGITTNPTGLGFATMVSEWDVFAQNTVSDLGAHTYNGISNNYITGYTNLSVAGLSQVVNGVNIFPATTYYYVVRAEAGACTSGDSNVIMVTTSAIPVYYSQGSGNVTDNIWDAVAVGSLGPAVWTAASNMVIQSGHVVTNTADVDLKDLDVQSGGELVLNAGQTMTVNGTAADLDGTITAAYGSTLALASTSATALGTTGTPVLSNLSVSTAAGTTLTGALDFTGTLDITDGTFDATGGTVRLLSDATNTGNLGQIGATANYSGNMTVQRYIPAGATNWRLLGSPVDGADVSDWDADFYTAGFPGSNYPTFDSPQGSNILWPSIREYDETNTGLANDGLEGVASTATLLDAGKGFAAWCGDNFTSTAAFTIDVTGPPNIASGPIDLPVTFTTGSGGAEDGWNLVSNPLPSAIDFTEVTLGANTLDGYYVYNPIDGTTEFWDEDLQTSTGTNLNGDIASSQGFWLKATAASPTNSSVDETAKVSGNGGPLFGGLQVPAYPIVRLNISSSSNTFQDNALVVFDLGAPEFEPIDAPKMFFSDATAPMIASLAPTSELMAINKYGAITEGLSIPVKVQTGVAGTYTITAGISGNPFSCMWLEDTQTGTLTALTDGAQYSFQLEAGASTTARFLMHSTAAVPMVLEGGLCGANGSATVDLGNNTADITWTTPTGTVVLEQLGATGENTFSTNNAGNYTVHISTNAVCGEMVQDFYIDIDATDVVAAFDAPADVLVNGTVEFTNNSTAYGAFFWNFGDNSTSTDVNPTHSYSEPGTYTVTLEVTADDCSVITTQEVVVSVNTGIATIASAGLNVWSNAQGIVMEHSFTEGTVKVEVLDATGRMHIQRQVAAAPGRTVIATDALNTGIWFVRVTNGDLVQSFRVPLVR